MGISDLRDLAVIDEVEYGSLDGRTVGVDFHNWIYRYLTILVQFTDDEVYTTDDGTELANLLGIVKGVPKFFENGLHPIFVFDGEVLELKEDELQRRRERKEAAAERARQAEEEGDEERAARLRARTQRLTPEILETSRELLEIMDLPIVEAPAEAEAQAAHMVRNGDIDYVGSEDYDTLLFGAPLTLRELTSKGNPECMNLEATLQRHGITREQLVDIAILCGTDYNDGVHGVGPKTALKNISAGETVEDVLEARGATIDNLDAVRSIFLSPTITDEYDYSDTLNPDIDGVEQYLTETWGIPTDSYERALTRFEDAIETENT